VARAVRARERKLQGAKVVLDANRRNAVEVQQAAGLRALKLVLERAQRELEARLRDLTARGMGDQTFSAVQSRATLKQVELVLRQLVPGVSRVVLDAGVRAADQFASHTAEYMRAADEEFRGVGTQPLALRESAMMEAAMQGARSSILRRVASSGEEFGVDDAPHKAKAGVLGRYGVQAIGHFERTLQAGVVARKSRAEMAEDLRNDSPFLRGAPAHWAERIVRTELHHAANAAGLKALKSADEQLGDMLKILSCVFDDRTGADSIAVHGQVRRVDEDFETWFGPCEHPPDRPNDRAVTTPHRMSWPIPEYLRPHPWEEVLARWKVEGRKGPPPPRPLMSTVDLSLVGKEEAPEEEEKKPDSASAEPEEKLRTTEEWAGDMHDALTGVLDEKSHMLDQIDASQKTRSLLRERVVGAMGLRSFDVEGNRPNADNIRLMDDDPKALANHHWNGGISVNRTTMRDAVRGLAYARDGEAPMPGQQRALNVLVHEEVHGASPIRKEAYRGIGVVLEEAGTEILARRATRELLSLDPEDHPDLAMPKFEWHGENSWSQRSAPKYWSGAYDDFIMKIQARVARVMGQVKDMDRRIEDAFVEIRTAKDAEFSHPNHQADAFCKAKALGLTEEQQQKLRDGLNYEWGT